MISHFSWRQYMIQTHGECLFLFCVILNLVLSKAKIFPMEGNFNLFYFPLEKKFCIKAFGVCFHIWYFVVSGIKRG